MEERNAETKENTFLEPNLPRVGLVKKKIFLIVLLLDKIMELFTCSLLRFNNFSGHALQSQVQGFGSHFQSYNISPLPFPSSEALGCQVSMTTSPLWFCFLIPVVGKHQAQTIHCLENINPGESQE